MGKLLMAACLLTFLVGGCSTLAPHDMPGRSDPVELPVLPAAVIPTEIPGLVPARAAEILEDPLPCRGADLVYHTKVRQMILVNCVADPGKATLLTLWGWDGTRWQNLAQDGPVGRILGAAAFDDLRNVLVLYGGRPVAPGTCSQETWEWDGEFWEQIDAQPPAACDHVRMVYDVSRQKSLLFGGLDPSEIPVHETWSWNGQQWRLLSEEGPERRGHFGLVYDPSRKQTLLFGGYAGVISDELWIWKNNSWEQLDVPGPGTLSHFGMTFDTDANVAYIFGGASTGSTFSSLTNETWVLKDDRWEQLRPVGPPSARGEPALGYDPVRKRVVLFGGFDSEGNNLDDTWEWDGERWTCMSNCEQMGLQ